MTEQIPSPHKYTRLHLQTWWSIKTIIATAQNDTHQTTDFCISIDMIFVNFYSSLWPWKIKVTLRNSTFQWNFSIPQLIHRLRREGSVLIL